MTRQTCVLSSFIGVLFAVSLGQLSAQQFVVQKMDLVSSQRMNRTEFRYSYTVDALNTGGLAHSVTATVTSTSSSTKIVSGTLEFGDVQAGAVATSSNTFTLQQDRTVPFDPHALVFTFQTGNRPPVADPGPDQRVVVGDTVQLDGSGSTDMDGDSLMFRWTFVSAPAGSGVQLSDATSVNQTLRRCL